MQSFLYIEPSEEGMDALTKQIASRIRKITSEPFDSLKGIAIGNHLEGKASQLSGLVDELIIVEAPSGSEFNTEAISKILVDIVSEKSPGVLFMGFTHQGMELAPAVGWRLGVPVFTSCVSFDCDNSHAYIKRPILGSNLLLSLSVNLEHGAVVSVQKGAWKEEVDTDKSEDSVMITRLAWKDSWNAKDTQLIGISEEYFEGDEDITKAEVLVSIGRGLGDAENLSIVESLADKLGGLISCSRPVVDLGWLPASRQVGISGRTVAPVIYLALGISGQGNHVAGMDGSKIIIAVNKDPNAPIFNVAHYGVVDDILEFIPGLLERMDQS